uniref:HABP4_PAI-RBP1 domain-containing protein n=1 Tax=Caenorhabditis tropicalis TaxID=1561998 RepID=A0A1I7TGE1_9PELO
MTEYGCQVANKFGLPSDDDDEYDDPRELIQKVSQIAAKKKEEKSVKPAQPTKPVAAPASAVTKTDGAGRGRGGRGRGRGGADRRPRDGGDRVSNENGDRSGENRRGAPRRGGERGAARPAGRGGRGGFTRENREGDDVKEQQVADDGQDTRAPRRRGGFTLGGGPSGGRGGGRGGRGRQFDRQSGSDRTGVRAFEKKDGHGKGNWGDQKDELAGETENIAPEGENTEPEVPREKTAEELAFEAEQAVLAKQKTLKEFRAAQSAEAPKFNTRKAGEGVADSFGKLVPMKKEVIPDREEEEIVVIHKAPRKQVLDISITFRNDRPEREQRNDRERSDRPPRGGPRGGGRGGRGGPRNGGAGGRHQNTPFNATDDAFPALGAK